MRRWGIAVVRDGVVVGAAGRHRMRRTALRRARQASARPGASLMVAPRSSRHAVDWGERPEIAVDEDEGERERADP